MPLSPQTFHLFGRERLASLRPDQILINSSRGEVVDGAALKEALKAEKEALKKMESLGEKQGEDTGKKKGRSH